MAQNRSDLALGSSRKPRNTRPTGDGGISNEARPSSTPARGMSRRSNSRWRPHWIYPRPIRPNSRGTCMATDKDEYFLGYRRAEQERLQAQARQLGDEARWLFDQIGVPEGSKVVEIGCGPSGCLEI